MIDKEIIPYTAEQWIEIMKNMLAMHIKAKKAAFTADGISKEND